MSNVRLRTNVLCTRIVGDDGVDIAAIRPAQFRHRLTYFELIALREANPLCFPGHWAEHNQLTEEQRIHRDAFLIDSFEPPWDPTLDGFVPFDPMYPLLFPARTDNPRSPPAQGARLPDNEPVRRTTATRRQSSVALPVQGQSPREKAFPTGQPTARVNIVDQRRVIESEITESLLVLAPPGTGKTHVLIERLAYLLNLGAFRNPAAEVLVLSFTRATVAEVRRRLSEKVGSSASDNIRYVAVTTFDAFATRVLAEAGFEHLLHVDGIRTGESSWDARVRALVEILEEGPGHERTPSAVAALRYLIVDEIQDLVGPRARLVQALMRHVHHANGAVLLLGDPAQAIYDWNQPKPDSRKFLADLRAAIHGRGQEVALGKFHRFADPGMEELVRQLWEAVGRDGSAPDGEELRRLLYSLGATRQFAELPQFVLPDRALAILVRNNAQAHQIAFWLESNGISCHAHAGERGRSWPAGLAYVFMGWKMDVMSLDRLEQRLEKLKAIVGDGEARRVREVLDACGVLDETKVDVGRLRNVVCTQPAPSEGRRMTGVVVSTVHRSKGLEYDTVLVLEPEHADDPEELRILYVAATRARRRLLLLRSDAQIVRQSRKAGRTGYWRSGNHIYLNRSQDLEPDVLADRLVRRSTPRELQQALWDRAQSASGDSRNLFLCIRERDGRQYFTVAYRRETGFEDICLCSDGLSRALWGQSRKAGDIGDGLRGWRVGIDGLETVAFPPDDTRATDALGSAGMAWLPILKSPVSTESGAGE